MKNTLHSFRVIVEKDGKEYHGFVPVLKGVHTSGKTIEEVKKNLNEAITCHIQGLLLDGEKIPNEDDSFEFVQSFNISGLRLSKYA